MGHGYVDVPIPPACGVPPVTRRGLDAAVETATAAIRGVGDYWASAIVDARTPLDIAVDGMRWWQIMTERRPPRWATRHRIVRRTALTRLRDFTPASPSDVVPTLVLPPQAGHDSCIVDFSTHQSQMRTIRAVGLDRLYSMDWIGATQATKDATISDYLGEIAASVDRIGGPVNLVGDCQGGWLATIYAALHPENVNTLTIAGAPIDFHAGDAVIHESVQALSDEDLRFYKNMVALGQRRPEGRVPARRLHRDQARERARQAAAAARATSARTTTSTATGPSRTGTSTRRTSRARSTSGSSSTCSSRTSSSAGP